MQTAMTIIGEREGTGPVGPGAASHPERGTSEPEEELPGAGPRNRSTARQGTAGMIRLRLHDTDVPDHRRQLRARHRIRPTARPAWRPPRARGAGHSTARGPDLGTVVIL